MDVERIIDEIEQPQEMFEAPDTRPLSASDNSAANRRHDEMLAHSPWFRLWQHFGVGSRPESPVIQPGERESISITERRGAMQGTQLRYAIKFVADMDKAVKFYRDVVGLALKFESPGWSEFATGETTLALHPASDKNPAGKVELGFTVADVQAFYRDMSAKGVLFTMPPKKQDFGGVLAQFVDSEGAHCSVGAEAG